MHVNLYGRTLREVVIGKVFLGRFQAITRGKSNDPLPTKAVISATRRSFHVTRVVRPGRNCNNGPVRSVGSLSVHRAAQISAQGHTVKTSSCRQLLLRHFTRVREMYYIPTSGRYSGMGIIIFPGPRGHAVASFPV